jgi:hypothetical protein
LLDLPCDTDSRGNAGDEGGARQDAARRLRPPHTQQVQRRRPVCRDRPREAQLGRTIAKLVGPFGHARRVDAEQRIERFDFDVESLHQRHRHAAQVGHAAAHAYLSDGARRHTDVRKKLAEFLREPRGDVLAAPHFRRSLSIDEVSPGQLTTGDQRAAAVHGDARRIFLDGNVRLDARRVLRYW